VAGYRDFQTGEVLTAANVNDFLMEQSVMTFADDAARTSALTDVLREGLLTYNEDTAQLEIYDGSAWVLAAPEPPAGIGSNVVQTVKTDTFTTSSTAFVDLMSLTITPSTDTSKVLIMYSVNFGNTNGGRAGLGVITDGADTVLVQADAAGSRRRATFGSRNTAGNVDLLLNHSGFFLWSPGADTAQTIKIRVAANANTLTVNRSGFDSNDGEEPRVVSSLTAIEVAA
jgi:hypothetical protein